MTVSNPYLRFAAAFPATVAAHGAMVDAKAQESALDSKTQHLAYLAVLTAVGSTSGIPFHVSLARAEGASDAEILSAALTGLPAVGLSLLPAFGVVAQALDQTSPQPS